jgi:hypothetical protein
VGEQRKTQIKRVRNKARQDGEVVTAGMSDSFDPLRSSKKETCKVSFKPSISQRKADGQKVQRTQRK